MSQRYQSLSKWLLAALSALLLAGCGNEFRPVAIPIIPPGGTPQAQRQAVVISNSSQGGTATNINVSGDTVFAVRDVGASPVHAALAAGISRTVVANDNDTLSTYLTFGTLTLGPTTTISLPADSDPVFVHSRETANAYVALSGSNFDPACGSMGGVGVISMANLALSRIVCAGTRPVALAQLPNGSKLYVVNQGSDNVTVINTADFSIAAVIPVDSSPSAIDVSADGTFVYVANTNSNTVTVINTTTDQLDPKSPVAVGNGPNFLRYGECPGQSGAAPTRKRIYVTNPASDSVSVIDADSATAATFLSVSNVSVGDSPVALTQLANCSKVYVANSGAGANSVSVIDGASLTVTATVPVGVTPIAIDSSSDSAQVFVANQGDPTGAISGTVSSGNVSVIRSSDDIKTIDIPLPPPPSLPPGSAAPVMTPKLLFVTP